MKKWILPVTVAVLAAALAYSVSRWRASCYRPAAGLSELREAAWLSATLGLTEAQAAAIADLQRDFVKDLESCCASHCQARMQLGPLLFQPDVSDEQLLEMVEKMCKAQHESDMATLTHIRRVHEVLNPEQQKRYEELVTGCVCAACPNHFNHVVSAR